MHKKFTKSFHISFLQTIIILIVKQTLLYWHYRIIPIRIEKVTTDNNVDSDDDDDDQHTIDDSNKINIISIEINNYCRYILYETIDNIQ